MEYTKIGRLWSSTVQRLKKNNDYEEDGYPALSVPADGCRLVFLCHSLKERDMLAAFLKGLVSIQLLVDDEDNAV